MNNPEQITPRLERLGITREDLESAGVGAWFANEILNPQPSRDIAAEVRREERIAALSRSAILPVRRHR